MVHNRGGGMDRAEILDNIESLFEKSGFYLSQRCCARPSCFDFAARREKHLVFVKVQPNIGNIYEKDAEGLAALARFFSGASLFICEKSRNRPLEDDTVYSRYGVGAITQATLENAISNGTGPLIEAGPGGYYVRLDGDAIRERRIQNGFSIGKMAEILGVSRRTLYGYERGLTKASVSIAYKLGTAWGVPVVKPFDIFKHPEEAEGVIAAAKRLISGRRFLQFVFKRLLQFNFAVFQLKGAPFDFVAKNPETKTNLLGGVANKKERNLDARSEEIASLSKVLEARPIFVADSKVTINKIPLFCREDFENIKCSEDLMARL